MANPLTQTKPARDHACLPGLDRAGGPDHGRVGGPDHGKVWPRRPDVQVRLLGQVDLLVDGGVRAVSGIRRKSVLAVLAVHAGEVVTAERLIDIVWGERVPRTAVNNLQSHISFLRRLIEVPSAILARSSGYLLDLGPVGTDLALARRLVRRAEQTQDPAEVVRLLREAVALWRGQPLRDVTGSGWTQEQAQQLVELRLSAHKALAQARLRLGQYAAVVAELSPLAREHRRDEQLQAQVMLALYRDGRPGGALEAYERLRSILDEELGIEPNPRLRRLREAIVNQDDDLGQFLPRL